MLSTLPSDKQRAKLRHGGSIALCRRFLGPLAWFLPALLFLLIIPFRSSGPKVPARFRVELILAAPDIEHPSVVTCDDDGNLFVGEDPMDMRGPVAEPVDRVLCLRWDRNGGPPTKTVFCDGLSAVFGLAWHQGALYVMHAPYYSKFVDTNGDGVADVRTDLARGFGPPAGKYEFNDHIVSGIRLGMDGWMYVSVGDKGIPQAIGADGSTISLEGGGIVRMRPDGTALEVVSSGTRNHLDVAIDPLDNLFTYDNTDDGLGWWTRFTHQIPTGYYGYPYDYRAHPDRHLPAISEHGPGAPAGAACYLEAAWPEKYRRSVFHCEWGKRRIQRFSLSPSGSSFAAEVDDFMRRGHNDEFRPLDLCFSPDGRHMYVADWNFGGWMKPDVAGRLYRVTYVGADVPPEPPRAAHGDPIDSQIRSLAHPAHSERMRGQWNLAARGEPAIGPVAAALRSNPSRLARIHAIWTQSALREKVAGYDPSADWTEALNDREPDVRAQAARALGMHRIVTAAPSLVRTLRDRHPAVRLQGAIALGRLGDVGAADDLVRALDETDFTVRFAIIQGLRALRNWAALENALRSTSPTVRRAAVLAATGVYEEGAVAFLARAISDLPVDEERTAALAALGEVHRRMTPPYEGAWWGGRPAGGAGGRPREVEWPGTPVVLSTLREALDVRHSTSVRRTAVRVFRDLADPAAIGPLRALSAGDADPHLRCEALMTLVSREDREALPLFATIAGDSQNDDRVRQEGVRGLIALGPEGGAVQLLRIANSDDGSETLLTLAIDALTRISGANSSTPVAAELAMIAERRLADPRGAIRARAIELWEKAQSVAGAPRLIELLRSDRDTTVRQEAIAALGRLRATSSIPAILESASLTPIKPIAQRALASMPDLRALSVYLDGLVSPNADLRSVSRRALIEIRESIVDELAERHRKGELSVGVRHALHPVFSGLNSDAARRLSVLFENLPPAPNREAYAEVVTKKAGNAARGESLFSDRNGVGCIQCHAVNGAGGGVGPDLAGIGALNRREELARSILDPSDRIAQSYELTTIVTSQGKVLSGMVRSETTQALDLLEANGHMTRIPLAEIDERLKNRASLMPTGLQEGMTLEDFADLIAYLEALKEPAGAGRR